MEGTSGVPLFLLSLVDLLLGVAILDEAENSRSPGLSDGSMVMKRVWRVGEMCVHSCGD